MIPQTPKQAKSEGVGLGTALTLLAASSLTVMSGATIAPALPSIRDAYAGSWQAATLSQLVLTIPALFIALIAPLGGRLVGSVGRRPVLLTGLVLSALAGSSGLWLPESWTLAALLAGRALLGIAVALVMVAATTLIGDYFSGDERRKLLGWQGAFMAAGGVVFLLLGGFFADIGWRLPFGVYFLSLLLVPLALALPEPERSGHSRKAANSWRETPPIYLVAFVATALFYLVPTQLPFLLKQTIGDQVRSLGLLAGVAIAASTATGVITGIGYGRVRRSLPIGRINAAMSLLMGIGFGLAWVGTTITAQWASAFGIVLAGMAILGLGTGLMMPNLNSWLLDSTSEATRGAAVGGLTTALFLGQFLSPIATAPLIARIGLPKTYLAAAGVLILAAIVLALGNTNSMKPNVHRS